MIPKESFYKPFFQDNIMIVSLHSHLLYTVFFFNDTATTEIYTLSLHDALPISSPGPMPRASSTSSSASLPEAQPTRSEEHTSELQSQFHLVCRLLLEKKK